jgi:arylsulfatase A-like enzyme
VSIAKSNALLTLALITLPVPACSRGNAEQKQTAETAPNVVTAQPNAAASVPAPAVPVGAPAASGVAPTQPLNVVLLTIDAMRADMPWAGYSRPIAPNLTKYAEQGTLYTRAYSVASYTAQSVASWLSGQFASTLYRTGVFFTSYTKANTFFPEVLQNDGVKSLGWFSHLYFGRGKGLERGFAVWEMAPGVTFDPQTDNYVTSDKMYDLGVKILGNPANTGGQFFAWAHFGDPHDQYIKHKEAPDFGNKNRDRYDSEIWYTDFYVGKLIDWAKTQPWWSHTVVIISADHGEVFGEHGQFRHAFELWEPLVRVPLIVMGPGVTAKRTDALRSLIDLAPTIMDLMGKKPLPQFYGQSLVSELRSNDPPRPRGHIELELTEDTNNPQRRALIAGNYKLLVRGYDESFSLFNLADDPGEEHNLAKSEPEKFAEMKGLYKEAFGKIPSIKPFGGMKLVSGKLADGMVGPPKK